MADQKQCEALVVGAGPTGLMGALLLISAGVKTRILERREEATRESRAFAVQARSLELFQRLGLADEMIDRGVIVHSVDLHVKSRYRGSINADLADAGDTPFPYILMIPQSSTEDILIKALERAGCEVERGVEVTDIAQDANGVTTSLIVGDGTSQTIRSDYVIGADGSRSIVRESAGIQWMGELLPQRFLLADCKVEWPLDHDHFRVFINGGRIGLFLPLEGSKLSRVMATDTSGLFGAEDGSKPAPLDLKEMEDGFLKAIGIPARLSAPVWVTRYRAHHRSVDTYGKGRVFVAGDAAHIHSPAGGQGMNTGFQDVENLAWKIAATLRGGSSQLLESYDSERRPVGHMVVKSTGKLFAAAAGQSGLKAALRDIVAVPALKIISRARPIQKKAFWRISQRNIQYDAGLCVAADSGSWQGGPRAGTRAPDARLSEEQSLFPLIEGYEFTVLALSRKALSAEEIDALDARMQELASALPGTRTHIVTRNSFGRHAKAAFAPSSDVFDRYGMDGPDAQALYVIRPDGYVGWRGEGFDIAAARHYMTRFS